MWSENMKAMYFEQHYFYWLECRACLPIYNTKILFSDGMLKFFILVESEATLESTNTQLAENSEQTERTLNRVSQLEKALKEIKSKKSEKEKEKIVNKLFDKKSVEIEVDETKKILDQRIGEKGELLKEIQLQNER